MKRVVLVLFSLLILFSIGFVEIGYRVFLSRQLVAKAESTSEPDPTPTFSFYAYPAPWRFDEKIGFAFNEGPWLAGSIGKGAFNGCGVSGPGNKYGNISTVHSDYDHAALKVILLGSSFTMGKPPDGKLTHDILEEKLSQAIGKPVSILNFSRDSTGLLNSFDIARTKMPELKPDLLLFVFNTTALSHQRHWRVVHRDPYFPGMWRMALALDPSTKLNDPRRVILQEQVISDEVTQEWCDRLKRSMDSGDRAVLQGDPLVRKLVATYQRLKSDLNSVLYGVNFFAPNVSFVYNKIWYKNPYYSMKVFEEKTIYAPLAIDDLAEDEQFVEAVTFVKQSGIPFLMIHIPTLSEMEAGPEGNFNFGGVGVPAERERSLAASMERLVGKPIIHLYSFYDPEAKRDPLALVQSRQDNHPSIKKGGGVEAMSKALENLLVQNCQVHINLGKVGDCALKPLPSEY